jgi:hypothetical protein
MSSDPKRPIVEQEDKRSMRDRLEQTPEGKLVGWLARVLGRQSGERGRAPDAPDPLGEGLRYAQRRSLAIEDSLRREWDTQTDSVRAKAARGEEVGPLPWGTVRHYEGDEVEYIPRYDPRYKSAMGGEYGLDRAHKWLNRIVGQRANRNMLERIAGEPSAQMVPVQSEPAYYDRPVGQIPTSERDATAVQPVGNGRGAPIPVQEDPVEELSRTLGRASYQPRDDPERAKRGIAPNEQDARDIWAEEGPVPEGLDKAALQGGGFDEGAVWRAVEPYARHFQIPQELAADVGFRAAAEGIPLDIAFRLVERESSYNPELVSGAGAHGYTQMTPTALDELHRLKLAPEGLTYPEMVRDPGLTLDMGFRYLAHLKDRYGDWDTALAKYSGNADSYADKVQGVPK